MRKIALMLVLLVMLSASLSASAAPAADESPTTPDPNCTGSLLRQIVPEDALWRTGYVAHFFSTLRNTPDGSVKQVFFHNDTFTAFNDADTFAATGLHQPTCMTGVLFWYVQFKNDDKAIGWASESQVNSIFGSNQRWLKRGDVPPPPPPPPPPATPTECDTAPEFQLEQGGKGEIALDFSTLRPKPGVPGEVIEAPATFTVYASGNVPAGYTQPTCAGGIAYWYIQYDGTGKFGWASEGNGSTYWLEPVDDAAAAPAG